MDRLEIRGKGEVYKDLEFPVENSKCRIVLNDKEVKLQSFRIVVRAASNVVQCKIKIKEELYAKEEVRSNEED